MKRTMNRIVLVVLAGLTVPPAAGAAVTARLTPAEKQDPAALPYRIADLSVDYSGPADAPPIRAAALHSPQGGPTFIYPLTVAPQTRQTLRVALPALTQQQEYAIRFLSRDDPDARCVASVRATVPWPLDLVRPEEFRASEAQRRWSEELPTWPAGLLRNVFFAAGFTCIALAATLFLRRPRLRLIAVGVVVATATAGVWLLVSAQPIVVERQAEQGKVLVVACRRTTVWRNGDPMLTPLYLTPRHLAHDDMIVHAVKGLTVPLRPDEVRLLRKRTASVSQGAGSRP